jgi:hypothetical protein
MSNVIGGNAATAAALAGAEIASSAGAAAVEAALEPVAQAAGLTGEAAIAKLQALLSSAGGGLVQPAAPPSTQQTVGAPVAPPRRLFHQLHPVEQTALLQIRSLADKIHEWFDRIVTPEVAEARQHLTNAVTVAEAAITKAVA